MYRLIKELDRILRGEVTRLPDLKEGTIRIPLVGICFVIVVLALIYGLCMSVYSFVHHDQVQFERLIATMIKVPALFYLTLLVTFPSLYVFNALVGSKLTLSAVFKLIIASMSVTLAVLASLGPIAAFFSFTTESYSFMVLLNVAVYAVAGILGLTFLLQTLHRLTIASIEEAVRNAPKPPPLPDPIPESPADVPPGMRPPEVPAMPPSALDASEDHVLGSHVRFVFRIWIVLFGLVGAQMAWVLRPFIGNPAKPFTWFRERESNFFEAVWMHIQNLFT